MIETQTLARAGAAPRTGGVPPALEQPYRWHATGTRWVRPALPRGPSPLARRLRKARAFLAAKLARRPPACC